MTGFTDNNPLLGQAIRKTGCFTDNGPILWYPIRKKGIFTDGRENIVAK